MNIKLKYLVFILSVIINIFFAYSTLVNKHYPYYELATTYRSAETYLKSFFQKETDFINNLRDSQSDKQSNYNEGYKSIETNLLPLKLSYKDLSSKKFAKQGGALTVINEDIILLDRLGYIYIYRDSLINTKISVNNNISEFVNNYNGKKYIGTTTLRAHKIIFDKQRNQVYASYTRFIEGNRIKLVVSSIKYDDLKKNNNNWTDIWMSKDIKNVGHSTQAGGGAILLFDDHLYISIGYSEDETGIKHVDSGKIFKINLINRNFKTFSSGHRNVQGITKMNNLIFATEHGPQGGDEINIISEGLDYGWPNHSFGTKYGSYDNYLTNNDNSNFELPMFSYVPSIGISSIIHSSNFHTLWKNNLLVGSLKSMTLKRLVLNNEKTVLEEDIFIGSRIRDIVEKKGKIILLNDNAELIFIELDIEKFTTNSKNDDLVNSDIFLKKCTICHNLSNNGSEDFGPNLYELKNRQIGDTEYKYYSQAIQNYDGIWNRKNLEDYLKHPNEFIDGTSMPDLNLTSTEISEIINYLFKD